MKTPQLPLPDLMAILQANGITFEAWPVVAVAIRGYYLDTMGVPGQNDRRRYDDAHFVLWPDGLARFVGNTDPNGYRAGQGTGASKGMASLVPGIHLFGTGLHKGRKGFRQAEPFTVLRDGNPPYRHTGWHAINWHDGAGTEDSVGATSSLGCQTNPPAVFTILRPLIYRLLDQYDAPRGNTDWDKGVRVLPYLLIEETERRKGNLVVSQRFLTPPAQ